VRISSRNLQQHHTTRNGRETEKRNNTSLGLISGREPCTPEGRNELNRTKGHVEQHSFELVETERLDNQWAECGDTTARNPTGCKDSKSHVGVCDLRNGKHQCKPEERLRVEERLLYMVPFPFVCFNTLLIRSQSIEW
jgi:hypothetical protein